MSIFTYCYAIVLLLSLILGRCYPIQNTKVALPQQISDLTIPNVTNNPTDSQSDNDVNDDEDNEDIEFDPY